MTKKVTSSRGRKTTPVPKTEKSVVKTTDPVSRVYGIAGKGNTEEIMSRLRGAK